MSHLVLHFLGPPRVAVNGEPVHIGRRKSVALLAYLAMSGVPQNRDALATLLWPGYDQSRARGHLRRALYALGKALGPDWLAAEHETVALDPYAEAWIDVVEFRQRLTACASHADGHPHEAACPECQALLTEAVELYQGDFLAGFTLPDSPAFGEWQRYQTQGLRDEMAGALERLAGCLGTQEEYEQAIAHARRWLELDALREPPHRCLMELYAGAGRRSEALRQYRECVRVLEAELGVLPAAETTALYERLRAEQVTPAEREEPAPTPSPVQLPAFLSDKEPPVVAKRPIFVAREAELAWLRQHLEAAQNGQGKLVFVTGGPGRGKTALMGEFARQALAEHPDLLVASGACNAYSGVGDPYLPFREVLAMLTGDVETRWAAGTLSREHARRLWTTLPLAVQALLDHGPHVIDALLTGRALYSRAAAAASNSPDWLGQLQAWVKRDKAHGDLQQAALFEQCTNVLSALTAQNPLLLTLDDLQWADAGSIGLLFHLGRRLDGSRVLIMGSYRPEEVASGRGGERHPLEKVVAEFRRDFGDVSLDLSRVDKTEGRGFVEALVDSEPNRLDAAYRATLHQHTGGHPLFTVELLKTMQERGDLVRNAEGVWVKGPTLDWETLPARVEAVIAERVGRLSQDLRDLLTVASVEGEVFTAQAVAQVQDVPEREVLQALSVRLGTRHRLVREAGEVQVAGAGRFLSRYRFAHALFQADLYNGLSPGERRLLHGEVGAALEGMYGEQSDEIVAQLAHHYDTAGQRVKAVAYTLRAGDQARRAYANDEAVMHYQRVLELLSPLGIPHWEQFVPQSGAETGGWQEGDECGLAALTGLGRVHFEGGDLADAEQDFRKAIALAREMGLAPRALARIYYRLAGVLHWQGRPDEQIRVAEEGLAHLGQETKKGEPMSSDGILESPETAMMYGHLFFAHFQKGNAAQSIKFAERFRQLAPLLPHTPEFRALFAMLGWFFSVRDKDIEGGTQWLGVLEEIATSYRHPDTWAAARFYTAELRARTGDLRTAAAHYQDANELYTRIGNVKNVGSSLCRIGIALLELGNINGARKHLSQSLQHLQATGSIGELPEIYRSTGVTALCRREWDAAADAFNRSLELASNQGVSWLEALLLLYLGRAYLAQGKLEQAIDSFQNALAQGPSMGRFWHPQLVVACAFSALEEAYDDSDAFHAFCRSFRDKHPERGDWGIASWYLEPTEPRDLRRNLIRDRFEALFSEWTWHDPFDDCSYDVKQGLAIRAANGRDLWHINLSAPRFLRPAPAYEAFAIQTSCIPVSDEMPPIGGLLLWKDKENYLRLDVGTRGADEISFQGCLENEDLVIGRGRLPVEDSAIRDSGVWLRLERQGDLVRALCSGDGEAWYAAGSVEFPFEGEPEIQVGLHAIGNIDRGIYHGAHPDGTAIQFEAFEMWGM